MRRTMRNSRGSKSPDETVTVPPLSGTPNMSKVTLAAPPKLTAPRKDVKPFEYVEVGRLQPTRDQPHARRDVVPEPEGFGESPDVEGSQA